jgi:hypothetical protein
LFAGEFAALDVIVRKCRKTEEWTKTEFDLGKQQRACRKISYTLSKTLPQLPSQRQSSAAWQLRQKPAAD